MRPSRYAASTTCCMRSIWDEKVVTITRPGAVANRLARAGPTLSSDLLPDTGTSALVESPSITSTPRSPSRASPGMSLRFDGPPMGRWSNLKSPVCTSVPAGQVSATATQSGIEWVTRRNSASNGPTFRGGSPAAISTISASPSRRCSSSFPRTSASVKRVPRIGTGPTSRMNQGTAPMWSSCPWVRISASMREAFSARYVMSGSTRSTPICSGPGNVTPESITTMRPSYSTTYMFLPISPTPPRGMMRSVDASVMRPRCRVRRAPRRADRARRRWPARAAGAGRPWESFRASAVPP